jgi:hypothetical protein
MKIQHNHTFQSLVLATAFVGALQAAPAQAENVYPLRLVVPCVAGTPHDSVARHIATRMYNDWGQHVLVENIPAVAAGARRDPYGKWIADGRTIVFSFGDCADDEDGPPPMAATQ